MPAVTARRTARRHPLPPVLAALLVLPSCGGGGGGSPTAPSTPLPEPGSTVSVVVFHDDNANGRLDANEGSRIPGVRVTIGARSGTSDGAGRATVSSIPAGTQAVAVDASTLPPFFQVSPSLPPVTVPATGETAVPLTQPIGNNNPRTYLTYGDSISLGVGSTDGTGYRRRLEDRLRAHFGGALILDESRDANATERGERLIDGTLGFHKPAYIVIELGTNDWQDPLCQASTAACPVLPHLRGMVRRTKARNTLPIVCTIPAINPAVNDDRNRWAESINAEIRAMASQEGGVLVADIYAAMRRRADLPQLYADGGDVHPNDAGYEVIAEALFEAIAHGRVE
jgi:lysophospholipase L1-like esterase